MPADNRQRQRQHAAELAARHIRQGGLDMASARHKAARQLGLSLREGNPQLPSRQDIERALASQLSLFGASDRVSELRLKRQGALEAMSFLQAFAPRLCGAVLDGSAQQHDPVIIQLHADSPEEVALFLHEQQLQAQAGNCRALLAQHSQLLPCWKLVVDEIAFELQALPRSALQQPPRHSIDGSALVRANTEQLRQLLASTR